MKKIKRPEIKIYKTNLIFFKINKDLILFKKFY
jgi:hypothetical protein